ncbi:MAG: lamin tail domain-containing protein [Tannerella sp.]|nr:lamin tail domain-containing protein [Tannerella sp.]
MTKNKTGLLLLFALLVATGVQAQRVTSIRINEILVVNEQNFVDEYGTRSGWIELFNTSAGTVNIGGCYLTDDPSNHKKYPIPKGDVLTIIRPRQHVLFWADGNASRGTFHLNFALDPDKENYIALYDADGKTLVDEIKIPAGQRADVSFGRETDGLNKWITLNKVTPSTNNLTLDRNDNIEKFLLRDSLGTGMTITAMIVVFIGLFLLFFIFKCIGKSAIKLSARRAKEAGVENVTAKGGLTDEGAIFAAIATALFEVEEDVHDVESTVLTINKVTRRYSPWSSKIYGMREFTKTNNH